MKPAEYVPRYVIVNPKTGAQQMGIFKSKEEAEASRDLAIEAYGLTTDVVIRKIVMLEGKKSAFTRDIPEWLELRKLAKKEDNA